jgi:hypothetical protein
MRSQESMEMVFLEKAIDVAQMALGLIVMAMPRLLYVVVWKRKVPSRKHAHAVIPPSNLIVKMAEMLHVVRMVAGHVPSMKKERCIYAVEKRLRIH